MVNTTFRPTYRPPWYWKPFTAALTGHVLLIRANLWGRNLSDMMKAAADPAIGAHYLAASQPIGNRRTFLRLERLEGYPDLMQQVVNALPSLPKAHLVVLEGGGHFPQEDAPDAVTAELNAYLTLPEPPESACP